MQVLFRLDCCVPKINNIHVDWPMDYEKVTYLKSDIDREGKWVKICMNA